MITKEAVIEIQNQWGRGVVDIGSCSEWQDSLEKATAFIKSLYILDGSLLFFPTKAVNKPFRPTLEAALSYFVGRDHEFPEDQGFALEPWTEVRFENEGIVLREDTALAMGHYFFSSSHVKDLKVEYTFAYVPTESGGLKIQAHHSALPYSA